MAIRKKKDYLEEIIYIQKKKRNRKKQESTEIQVTVGNIPRYH